MTKAGAQGWIEDGEKYALVAIGVKLEGALPFRSYAPNLCAFGDTTFSMPSHWREWLGTIRAGEVESSNLFLLSKLASRQPEVLDGENQQLDGHAWRFYLGLLLASRFAPAHKPVLLSGSCLDGEIGVRQQKDLEAPVSCLFRGYPVLEPIEIERAAQLAGTIDAIQRSALPGGHWRLFRSLSLYTEARTIDDLLERIHQYCRCIEGLILPSKGDTARQFKSRTELFIGPRHHDFIGEMYEMRSAAEHLHESRYLETFDRNIRLDLVRKEAVAEAMAREALGRVIECPALWPHFANTSALDAFWSQKEDERLAIWGAPTDPMHVLKGFDPRYIHDGVLS